MLPEILFFACLLSTVGALVGAVITGFAARRKQHFCFVGTAVLFLVLSIWAALRLGEYYDLESGGTITRVHLAISRYATGAYLLPVLTGIATLRNPARRKLHRVAAFVAIAITLVTAVTGTWMLIASERLS